MLAVGAARFARTCAKNIVKLAIGRKTYLTPGDVFFLACIRELCGRPSWRITCRCSTHEGAGSQALMTLRTIAFARTCGLQYAHSPFTQIAHADRPMREYAEAWENALNLGAGEVASDDERRDVNFAFTFPTLLRWFGLAGLEALTESLARNAPSFRSKYAEGRIETPKSDLVVVALHVRRGDVREGHGNWTAGSNAARTIVGVRRALKAESTLSEVRVYSEGAPHDFPELEALGVEFRLECDPIRAMDEMIDADVLITAKSSFSYVAGLLSGGIKLTELPDRPRRDDWITLDSEGGFDENAFRETLGARSRSKGPP